MAQRKIDMALSVDTKTGRLAIKKVEKDVKAFSNSTVTAAKKSNKAFDSTTKSINKMSTGMKKTGGVFSKITSTFTRNMKSVGKEVDNVGKKIDKLNKKSAKGISVGVTGGPEARDVGGIGVGTALAAAAGAGVGITSASTLATTAAAAGKLSERARLASKATANMTRMLKDNNEALVRFMPNAKQVVSHMKAYTNNANKAADKLKKLAIQQEKANKSIKDVSGDGGGGLAALNKRLFSLKTLYLAAAAAAAYLGYKVIQQIKQSAMLAARYETLGVVLNVVAKNTGVSSAEADKLTKSLETTGISALQAKQNLIRMMQANIDVAKATDLARIAQDAAVIANIDSSQAFERLINGIQTAQVEVLRNIGITVSFERAYKKMAATLDTTADKLTEQQKVQARLNAVIGAGKNITGTYTASLDTVSKKIGSLKRPLENLSIKFGEAFQPALKSLIDEFAFALEDISTVAKEEDFQKGLVNISIAIGKIAEAAVTGGKHVAQFSAFLSSLFATTLKEDIAKQKEIIDELKWNIENTGITILGKQFSFSTQKVELLTRELKEAEKALTKLNLKLETAITPGLMTLTPDKLKKKAKPPEVDATKASVASILDERRRLAEAILNIQGRTTEAQLFALETEKKAHTKAYGEILPVFQRYYDIRRKEIENEAALIAKTAENQRALAAANLKTSKVGAQANILKAQLEITESLGRRLELIREITKAERDELEGGAAAARLEEIQNIATLELQAEKDKNINIEEERVLHKLRLQEIEAQATADLIKLFKERNAAIKESEQKGQSDELKLWQEGWGGKADVVSGMLGDVWDVLQQANKKQFELGKKFAIAQAIIDSIASAQKAFTAMAGIPVVGPALGVAAATTALAAGFARVNAIKSTQYSGQAHDGLDNVPKTGTFLLEEGERVVKKKDNKMLEHALKNGGLGGGVTNIFNIDAREAQEGVELRIRAGIEEAVARSYNTMMEDKIRRGPFSRG